MDLMNVDVNGLISNEILFGLDSYYFTTSLQSTSNLDC